MMPTVMFETEHDDKSTPLMQVMTVPRIGESIEWRFGGSLDMAVYKVIDVRHIYVTPPYLHVRLSRTRDLP